MTLNDLIKEAQSINNNLNNGDIPLNTEIHLEFLPIDNGIIDIKIPNIKIRRKWQTKH